MRDTIKFGREQQDLELPVSRQGVRGGKVKIAGKTKKGKKKSKKKDAGGGFGRKFSALDQLTKEALTEAGDNKVKAKPTDISRMRGLMNNRQSAKAKKKVAKTPAPPKPPPKFRRTGAGAPPLKGGRPPPDDISESSSEASLMSGDEFDESNMSLASLTSAGSSIPTDESMSLLYSSSEEEDDLDDSDLESIPPPPPKKVGGKNNAGLRGMTQTEAEAAEKSDLLARFAALKKSGVHISKNYTSKSNLNEMRMEMGRLEHEREVAIAIQNNRHLLMAGASGFESVATRFGPKMVSGRVHKFSHYLYGSIKEYDSAFERLSEQYGDTVGMFTGGDALREIMIKFVLHLGQYMLFGKGEESAKVNEDLTEDDILKKYPNLVRAAADKIVKDILQEERAKMQAELRQQQQPSTAAAIAPWARYTGTPLMSPPPAPASIPPPTFNGVYRAPAPPAPPQAPAPPVAHDFNPSSLASRGDPDAVRRHYSKFIQAREAAAQEEAQQQAMQQAMQQAAVQQKQQPFMNMEMPRQKENAQPADINVEDMQEALQDAVQETWGGVGDNSQMTRAGKNVKVFSHFEKPQQETPPPLPFDAEFDGASDISSIVSKPTGRASEGLVIDINA